jgi:hypothetical protein
VLILSAEDVPAAFFLRLWNPPLHDASPAYRLSAPTSQLDVLREHCSGCRTPPTMGLLTLASGPALASCPLTHSRGCPRSLPAARSEPQTSSGGASVSICVNKLLLLPSPSVLATAAHHVCEHATVRRQFPAGCALLQLTHRRACPGYMRSCNSAQPHGNPANRSLQFAGGRLHLSGPIHQPLPSLLSGSDIRLDA